MFFWLAFGSKLGNLTYKVVPLEKRLGAYLTSREHHPRQSVSARKRHEMLEVFVENHDKDGKWNAKRRRASTLRGAERSSSLVRQGTTKKHALNGSVQS